MISATTLKSLINNQLRQIKSFILHQQCLLKIRINILKILKRSTGHTVFRKDIGWKLFK